MKDNLMQKMFGVFESIIKSEGATALTNERIKKCCEENGVDYEEFSASVIEEVLSVIGAHSGTSGDVLLSELSSRDLEAVSGGMGTFRRGTASALAALSLCGATQLPASAVKHTNRQVVPEKVASRHLKKRSGDESILTSQAAQNIAKYFLTAALGSFLTYLLMSRMNGEAATPAPAPDQTTDLEHPLPARKANITVTTGHPKWNLKGFLPESTNPPAKDWFTDTSDRKVTPYLSKEDGQLFRIEVLFDTLRCCQNTFKFSIKRTDETKSADKTKYTAQDVWELPLGQPQPTVISEYVKSVRVTAPPNVRRYAKIWMSNARLLQTIVAIRQSGIDISRIALLDLANAFTAGGAPFSGCAAQEESICRITTLYPLLRNLALQEKFYGPHTVRSREYLNEHSGQDLAYWEYVGTFRDCIYVPGVKQIKNDYGASRIGGFINGPTFNIIAAAAPDLRQSQGLVDINSSDYRECFKKLWRQIISTAYTKGNDNLAAGAIGCGAFRNDPKVVAETFFDVLMNEGPDQNTRWAELFKNVILPIYIHKSMSQDAVNYAYFLIEASKYEGLNIERFDLDCPE